MANYLCRLTGFRPVDSHVIDVLVPTGSTYRAGQVIMVKNLDTSITGNQRVWEAVVPATAELGRYAAVILGGGDFEQLSDGRRPEGNPDYTTYSYAAGQVAPALILFPGNELEISQDSLDGSSIAVGNYLEPADGVNYLHKVTTRTSGVKSAAKVLALNNFRAGGMFGASFISTFIVKVLE